MSSLDGKETLNNYDKAAVGYLLHNFYNGCENIFKTIARFFENQLADGSWHKDLLRRMTLDIEGYRPGVISRELFLLLDDFRSFRHKFRHSYSFELDWVREKIVADKYSKTWKLFRTEIETFLNRLDSIAGE